MIDPKNWGSVKVSPNIKKTSETFKITAGGVITPLSSSTVGETKQERFERIKRERGIRLGFIKE